MKITVATGITCIRIMLVPVIISAIMQNAWGQVLLLYGAAMVTDFLDGFVARRYKQESTLGALLDPVADKLLICASMYGLTSTIVTTSFLKLGIYFVLLKELILVVGASVLFVRYNFFIRPTLFSRVVSVSEMLFVMLVVLMSYAGYAIPLFVLYLLLGFICVSALLLLAWYSVIIAKFIRKSV